MLEKLNDIENEIVNYERKISQIFNEVTTDKEFTLYDCRKDYAKILDIANMLKSYNSFLEKDSMFKEVSKIKRIILLMLTAMFFCSIGLASFPIINIFLCLMAWYLIYRKLDKTFTSNAVINEKKQVISSEIAKLIRIRENRLTFLKKKDMARREKINSGEITKNRTSKIELAKYYLDCYLANGYMAFLDKEVEEELIKILQNDLEVDITDLDILLYLAQKEINRENEKNLGKFRENKTLIRQNAKKS